MKIGMPALVECGDIYGCLKVAERLKLDFVEINMSFPGYLPSALDPLELLRIGKDIGVGYTVHADEMLNPFDFNSKISSAYFEVMRDTLRFAAAAEMPIVNMHLLKGVYVTTPGKVLLLNDVYRDEYLTRVRDFIKMCESETANSGVRIAIENVDSNPFTEAQLEAIELFIGSPAFALTLDTGHEMCLDFADGDVYSRHCDRVAHLHLHDSDGSHAHLPLGSGRVDIPAKLSQLTDGTTCLVEVKTVAGLEESINYLRTNNLILGERS